MGRRRDAPGCDSRPLIDITADAGNYWQGAAGQRQAKFTHTNGGSTDCIIKAKSQPLLLNGDSAVLITGAAAGTSASVAELGLDILPLRVVDGRPARRLSGE